MASQFKNNHHLQFVDSDFDAGDWWAKDGAKSKYGGTGFLKAREDGTFPEMEKTNGHPRTAGSIWHDYWKSTQRIEAHWGLNLNTTSQDKESGSF